MKLHLQVKEQKKNINTYEEGLMEITRYLNSEKFAIDDSVNKQDILSRIENIRFDIMNNEG